MNYTIYRKDREGRHGGVMMAISLGLSLRFTCQTLTPRAKFYGLNSVLQIAKTFMSEPFIDHTFQT